MSAQVQGRCTIEVLPRQSGSLFTGSVMICRPRSRQAHRVLKHGDQLTLSVVRPILPLRLAVTRKRMRQAQPSSHVPSASGGELV